MENVYYSTQRPITPGSIPKPSGNRIIEVRNFPEPVEIAGIGRTYGVVRYEQPLTDAEWKGSELIPTGYHYWYGARFRKNADGTGRGIILSPVLTNRKPEGREKKTERATISEMWFEMYREAEHYSKTGIA